MLELKRFKGISEKNYIVYLNVAGAFLVQGAALVVSLFTMPAYMKFFSEQQVLGVWFTILSVFSWILNLDLGIGNGLRNKLTIALTQNNRKAAKEYVASAYWMTGGIVAIGILIGCIMLPRIDWNIVFNVESSIIATKELEKAVGYAFVGIMLQFFFRLISSVLYALQKSAINNLLALLTSVLQLIFVSFSPVSNPEKSLITFSAAYIVCVNLPLVVSSVWVFKGPLKDCRPSISSIKKGKIQEVLSLGGMFFVCQILYMGIVNINEFIITQYTSPADVVEYQIYNRVFTLGSMLFMLALSPIWSTVSKAVAEEDYIWLKRLRIVLNRLSLLAVVFEFLIIPILPVVLKIWLGNEAILVNYTYAVSFAFWGSTMIFQGTVSTITNGMGMMRTQAICYGVGILMKMLIIHIGVGMTKSWIIVVIANGIILIPYCIIQNAQLKRYIENRIRLQE